MTLDAHSLYMIMGGGIFAVMALLFAALAGGSNNLEKRLARVSNQDNARKIGNERILPGSVRSTKDSAIPLLDRLTKLLPNPDKLRSRLAATGKNIALGEYVLMNALAVVLFYMAFNLLGWAKMIIILCSIMLGLGLPHMITGIMGARRIKKFLGDFPEAIDTMCRGIRSGLPITESIAAVGREMPDPVGIEFHRISDGVRMGKTLEASMWEVAQRITSPEFRFLIIAMAIQKETGGNLAETLGNLSDLIRKRRQLKLKVKAMSSEAKASAAIIGSLPFIMFLILMLVNSDYVMLLFQRSGGRMMVYGGMIWMLIGWAVMMKMVSFEI